MGSIREMGQDAGASRRQNPAMTRLPDYCNLGIWLRVLLAVNFGALAVSFARNRDLSAMPHEFAEIAAFVEPVVFGSLLLLCALRRLLHHLSRLAYLAAAMLVPVLLALLFSQLLAPSLYGAEPVLWRSAFWYSFWCA